MSVNDHLVLICGNSGAGKSASLMGLENPEGVMYLNCEAGKKLPFKAKFKQYTITDPLHASAGIAKAETMSDIHTIALESLNFLMEMYVSVHIKTAVDTQAAWGNYQEFFKDLMQQKVARSTKNIIFTGHVKNTYNAQEMSVETRVPIQGAIGKGSGVEAYFSVIIGAKKMTLEDLEPYQNDLLIITDDDELLGYKHVFQTRLTKETVNEKIRSPLGMWERNETFINNDTQLLINRLREYYN